mgnify:FL=1
MQTFQILIKGNVQSIFYRIFTKLNAKKLNVTGTVKNLNNGDVEILANCNKETLNQFIKLLKLGPLGSDVTGINFKEIPAEKIYKDFNIIY